MELAPTYKQRELLFISAYVPIEDDANGLLTGDGYYVRFTRSHNENTIRRRLCTEGIEKTGVHCWDDTDVAK
jgi:hypothetical protein